MQLIISPYRSMGLIQLGMIQKDIKKILEGEVISNEKELDYAESGVDVNATDYFSDLGIKIEYNDDGKCCFVEVDDKSQVIFKKQLLFGKSFQKIISWFHTIDSELKIDNTGFTSLKYGISIYAPEYEELPLNPPKLISIFQKRYYDELIEQGIM